MSVSLEDKKKLTPAVRGNLSNSAMDSERASLCFSLALLFIFVDATFLFFTAQVTVWNITRTSTIAEDW